MVFYIFALVVVALIYFNVFGLFHGYKDIPEGPYKQALWFLHKEESDLSEMSWAGVDWKVICNLKT